jgi:hypothetical protein
VLVRRYESGEYVTESVTTGHETGPAYTKTGPVFPGSGGRIRTADLWVMRRMAPVPRIPSCSSMSRLARQDRAWCPTLSMLSERFPQRPYYRFYYTAAAS